MPVNQEARYLLLAIQSLRARLPWEGDWSRAGCAAVLTRAGSARLLRNRDSSRNQFRRWPPSYLARAPASARTCAIDESNRVHARFDEDKGRRLARLRKFFRARAE